MGGFAASDWLYQKLKVAFTSEGLDVSRPDSHVCVFPLKGPRSGTNYQLVLATRPSPMALYPSTLIILCRPESRSLLTGQKSIINMMPLIMNTSVESTRRSWQPKASSESMGFLM